MLYSYFTLRTTGVHALFGSRISAEILTWLIVFHHVFQHKQGYILTFTLLDTNDEGSVGSAIGQAERWHDYMDKFVLGGLDPDVSDDVREHLKRKPIFLKRYVPFS